jgi:sugar lactone lactonase YvrE
LRGVVLDTTGVTQVYINGDPVSSSDNLATWTYTADLTPGENELVITEETADGITEIDSVFVERAPNILVPRSVVDDSTNNRLIILDVVQGALIAADKDTGTLATFSPPAGTTNKIKNPRNMVLDANRNRVLVYQIKNNVEDPNPEFLAVDLTTGEQSVPDIQDFTDVYLSHSPNTMTVSEDTAFVADIEAKFFDADGEEVPEGSDKFTVIVSSQIIYSINLQTGVRTVVSSSYRPEKRENLLAQVTSLTYNPTTSTLYALDTGLDSPRLLAINLTDGKRTPLSLQQKDSTASFSLRVPSMLDMDVTRQRLLLLNTNDADVFDLRAPGVAAIDLATKKAEYLTSNTIPENGAYVMRLISSMTYSAQDDAVYVLDATQNAVFRVDAESGVRSVAAATGPVDERDYIGPRIPYDVFLDNDHEAYLLDGKLSSVFGYNLYFGHKYVLSNSDIDNLEAKDEIVRSPVQGAADPVNGKILLANAFDYSLVAFDVVTREATRVGGVGGSAVDMVTDAEAGITYVALKSGNLYGIAKFDLNAEYARVLLSGGGIPDWTNDFTNLRGIALDKEHGRLLAVDSNLNAVLAVNLETGTRTYFSPPSATPADDGALLIPRAITMDPANNRALVLDTGRKAIMAVDLSTGERSVVYQFGNQVPRRLFNPTHMEMHPTFGYLLLFDESTNANTLMALDLNGPEVQLVTLVR